MEVGKVAVVDPMSQAGIATAAILAGAGEGIAVERQHAMTAEIAPHIENAFIILDDLDRCDADAAWAILKHARRVLPKTKMVCAIVCDPVVLGHHISHVLGVPLAHGFQAVLKYIDVPLKIPMTFTDAHLGAIQSRLQPHISVDWKIEEIARGAVGSIPMRDILAALPQTCLWIASWDSRLRPKYASDDNMKHIAEVVFFCALLHICVPNAAQVIASGKRDWLEFNTSIKSISQGWTGPMKDSTQSAVQRNFGGIVQEVIEARMDLIRFARARNIGDKLTSVKVGPDGSDDCWNVLWDVVRS